MALRRLTWVNWIEIIFGAVLPTMFFGSLAIVWLVGAGSRGFLFSEVTVTLFSAIGLAALAFLWLLLLMGPAYVNQHPVIRWLTLATGSAGIALGILMIYGGFTEATRQTGNVGSALTWQKSGGWMLLLGPVIVGSRYLPSLIKGR